MKIYIKERGHRAQRLASTRTLAGALQRAASSDTKSDSFSTTLRAVKGGSKNWYRTTTSQSSNPNLGLANQKW